MDQKNPSEEIDMLDLFRLIKRGFIAIGDVFLRFFNFLLRNIIILVILVVVGVLIGWFLDSKTEKTYKTEVIVATNYDSGEYLYKAINEIGFDLSKPDSTVLKKIGVSAKEAKKLKIEVEPVVVLKPTTDDEQRYMVMIKENNLLDADQMKEMFKKSAEEQKITLYHPLSVNSTKVLDKIVSYLRENEFYEDLNSDYYKTLTKQIKSNNFVESQIDSLFQNYSKGFKSQAPLSNNLTFFNNTLDLGKVLQFRLDMQEKTLELLKDRMSSKRFLRVVDQGRIQEVEHSALHNNLIKIPMLLIGLFFLVVFLRFVYGKSRELAREDKEIAAKRHQD